MGESLTRHERNTAGAAQGDEPGDGRGGGGPPLRRGRAPPPRGPAKPRGGARAPVGGEPAEPAPVTPVEPVAPIEPIDPIEPFIPGATQSWPAVPSSTAPVRTT